MDLELKWTKEKLLERDKQISKLIAENSRLRDSKLLEEDIREGITLRDHFAGLAMQGFISLNKFNTDMSVKLSYDMADAMLEERMLAEGKKKR
jgi:hypothetical protein